jgi:hypothetical protein
MGGDGTGLGSCPVAGFGVSGVGLSGSAIRDVNRFYFNAFTYQKTDLFLYVLYDTPCSSVNSSVCQEMQCEQNLVSPF